MSAEQGQVPEPALSPALATIAQRCFGTKDLVSKNADALDFREIAVWNLREALEAAYEAGRQVGQQAQQAGPQA